VYRLGVVSFLNSRPLIAGLAADHRVELLYDVPARLPDWLDEGHVDAALIPIIDVLHSGGRYHVLSDACIGCDGETMTVRVFSQIPPDRIRALWVDSDSHTSVALATVLWRRVYGCNLELRRLDARRENLGEVGAVLLIGDKVVAAAEGGFSYEMDLGAAWRLHTGLPFVFAVWACRNDRDQDSTSAGVCEKPRASARTATLFDTDELARLLSTARDRGVAEAARIARLHGPELGWPVELAERYLTRCLKFKLDARSVEGANLFTRLCAETDIIPGDARICWPENLAAAEGQ
jgi:chorismate dehydratase